MSHKVSRTNSYEPDYIRLRHELYAIGFICEFILAAWLSLFIPFYYYAVRRVIQLIIANHAIGQSPISTLTKLTSFIFSTPSLREQPCCRLSLLPPINNFRAVLEQSFFPHSLHSLFHLSPIIEDTHHFFDGAKSPIPSCC